MRKIVGNNLLKHEGLSGFAVEVDGDVVTKWTCGEVASKKLMQSAMRQKECFEKRHLYPIEAVRVLSYSHNSDRFSFSMPYVDAESGLTTTDHETLERKIRESFRNRKNEISKGFNKIILKELRSFKRVPDDLAKKVEAQLRDETDCYAYGYTHGDFGLANLFVDQSKVLVIDFAIPFINSPLLDLATLELSARGIKANREKHLNIVRKIYELFPEYRLQVHILKQVHLLRALNGTVSPQARADIVEILNE